MDERRRRSMVEGARVVEPDDRPGDQGRRSRATAASARPNGAKTRSFDTMRQSYLAISDKLLGTVEEIEGIDDAARSRLRFATKGFVDAMSPANFARAQPAGDEADDRDQGRKPHRRPQEHARRHPARAGQPEPRGRVRAWPQPRGHPGQGDPRNAALPADPVHAGDRAGARNPARHLPAVDQPLLHPRPHAREKLRQMDRRPGRDPVHGQLEIGRRQHRRRHAGRLYRGPARGGRGRSATCSGSRRSTPSAIASRAPRSPRASLISRPKGKRSRSPRRPSSPRRSISRRPATSSCSSATTR